MERICTLPLYKELFDPYSGEWSQSDYDVKAAKIREIRIRAKEIQDCMFVNLLEIETKNRPLDDIAQFCLVDTRADYSVSPIPLTSKILSSGFYLAKGIDPEFSFPQTSGAVTDIAEYLATLKDRRKKRTRQIEELQRLKRINTRNLFDQHSAEFEADSIAEKLETLTALNSQHITPLELLYYHYYQYSVLDHYRHIVQDIPDSVMRLYCAAVR